MHLTRAKAAECVVKSSRRSCMYTLSASVLSCDSINLRRCRLRHLRLLDEDLQVQLALPCTFPNSNDRGSEKFCSSFLHFEINRTVERKVASTGSPTLYAWPDALLSGVVDFLEGALSSIQQSQDRFECFHPIFSIRSAFIASCSNSAPMILAVPEEFQFQSNGFSPTLTHGLTFPDNYKTRAPLDFNSLVYFAFLFRLTGAGR